MTNESTIADKVFMFDLARPGNSADPTIRSARRLAGALPIPLLYPSSTAWWQCGSSIEDCSSRSLQQFNRSSEHGCRGDRLGADHCKSLHPSRNHSTTQ